MTARWTAVPFVLAFAIIVPVPAKAQTPLRDAARPVPVGTALISGTIVSDDPEPKSLRRVRVSIATSDRRIGRTTISTDDGRFAFSSLPAGRYLLSAVKQGYVTAAYGAKRPNRPGSALVLADGQRLADVTLRLTRGSVVSGTVVDQNGEPFSGITVSVQRYLPTANGQRTLVPAGQGQSDDRGQYRVWNLPAGEYFVSTNAVPAGASGFTELTRLTDADIRRAMAEVSAGPARPDARTGIGKSSAPANAAARTVGYASVFYPGTPIVAQATPIEIGPGEERTGIDFGVSLVPTSKVEGTITVPEGINAQRLVAQLVASAPHGVGLDFFRRATVAADGTFAFAGLPPGAYAIIVTGMPPAPAGARSSPPTPGQSAPRPTHYARADVIVDGQNITGLALTLQAGFTVSGRVVFEGASTPPDASRIRLNLQAMQAAGEVSIGVTQIQPDADGAFSLVGVAPGRYRLSASIVSPRPESDGWQLKSTAIDGRETTDVPIDIAGATSSAVVTFTDRVSNLSGQVRDASGQPAPEYHIVLFPRDKSYWAQSPRRIRSARPAADGTYTMPLLPPGDYLIAAVTDLEPGEQFDPAFLEMLTRTAVPVTIAEGEKKTQDLRLGVQ